MVQYVVLVVGVTFVTVREHACVFKNCIMLLIMVSVIKGYKHRKTQEF